MPTTSSEGDAAARALLQSARLWCEKWFRPLWSRAKLRRREFPRRSPPLAIPRQARRSGCPACRSHRSCPPPRAARCSRPVPPSRCAVTNTTREACRRSVSEICAEAAAPKRRSDSRNQLEIDASRAQDFHFFARAPEKQRVAALEPRDNFSFARQLHHQRVNLGLRNSFRATAFSDIHNLRGRRKDAQNVLRHKVVVQYNVSRTAVRATLCASAVPDRPAPLPPDKLFRPFRIAPILKACGIGFSLCGFSALLGTKSRTG